MSILFIPFIFFLLFQLWRQIMRKRCNIPWRDPFSGGGWCHPAAVLFLISQEEVEEEERLLPFFPLRPHLHFEVLVVVVVFWLFLPRVGGGGVRRCIITPFTSFYFSQIRRQHVHINRRPSGAVVKRKRQWHHAQSLLGSLWVEVGDETHDIPWSWQGRQLPRRFLSISSFQKTFVICVMSAKLTLFLCLLATRGPSPVERKTHGQSRPRLLMFRNNLNVSIVLVCLPLLFLSFFLHLRVCVRSFVSFLPRIPTQFFDFFFSLSLRQRPRKIPKIDGKKKEILFLLDRISWKKKKKFPLTSVQVSLVF